MQNATIYRGKSENQVNMAKTFELVKRPPKERSYIVSVSFPESLYNRLLNQVNKSDIKKATLIRQMVEHCLNQVEGK